MPQHRLALHPPCDARGLRPRLRCCSRRRAVTFPLGSSSPSRCQAGYKIAACASCWNAGTEIRCCGKLKDGLETASARCSASLPEHVACSSRSITAPGWPDRSAWRAEQRNARRSRFQFLLAEPRSQRMSGWSTTSCRHGEAIAVCSRSVTNTLPRRLCQQAASQRQNGFAHGSCATPRASPPGAALPEGMSRHSRNHPPDAPRGLLLNIKNHAARSLLSLSGATQAQSPDKLAQPISWA